MQQTKDIHIQFSQHEAFLDDVIINYDSKGEDYGNQKRNSLKLFKLDQIILNVKSFRIRRCVKLRIKVPPTESPINEILLGANCSKASL